MARINSELWLFDMDELPKGESAKEKRIKNAYEQAPDGIALVYSATEYGNSTDGHFFLTIDDAKKLCSDPRSCGVLHGTRWSFFWTSLKNYVGNYWDFASEEIDFTKFRDNGSRDSLLLELGIKKLDFAEIFFDLENRGFKIKRNPLCLISGGGA